MILGRVTPIVPRFSATLVELKVQRWLQKYDITLPDTFQGAEALGQKLASRTLPAGLQDAFERANKSVEESFSGLKKALAKLDPTLVEACQTGRFKSALPARPAARARDGCRVTAQ